MKLIYQLKKAICRNIEQHKNLKKEIEGIFFISPENAKFPYILIDDINLTLSAIHEQSSYNIDIDLSLFTRNIGEEELSKLQIYINEAVSINPLFLDNYEIVSIQAVAVKISNGKDLITTKTEIEYKIFAR